VPVAPLALSQSLALLLLFVVLPFAVAAGVIAFINWRSESGPPPVRTSELLASGERAEAEIVSVRPLGGFLDVRPMVKLRLSVRADGGPAFELEVVQSFPRPTSRQLRVGDRVEVRLSADRRAGAVVPPADPT